MTWLEFVSQHSNLISALLGAVFGSFGSVLTVYIQSKKDERNAIRALALQLALDERKEHLERAKISQNTAEILPSYVYVYHAAMMLNEVSRGRLKSKKIIKIQDEIIQLRTELKKSEITYS